MPKQPVVVTFVVTPGKLIGGPGARRAMSIIYVPAQIQLRSNRKPRKDFFDYSIYLSYVYF